MSEPFLGEVSCFAFGYEPEGWAPCDGRELPIAQNQALYSLLGTTYGGDGRVNFALPNLQGRTPTHTGGEGHFLGEAGGEQAHTLSISEMPSHTHVAQASSSGVTTNIPDSSVLLGSTAPNDLYTGFASPVPLQAATVANVGGSQAHLNMQPFLTLSFCIALQGIFPSQN